MDILRDAGISTGTHNYGVVLVVFHFFILLLELVSSLGTINLG
jgi:hypothetical protein